MKKSLLLVVVSILSIISMMAQNVAINSSGYAPDASAGLDVNFTDKGLLIPRVDIADLSSSSPISSPAVSLVVYNTNTTTGLGYFYWDGGKWVELFDSNNGRFWKLSGNSGTTEGTDFLGTTDNKRLDFRTNNAIRASISSGGNVGIGTTNPQALLQTEGGEVIMVGPSGNINDIGNNDVLAVVDASRWPINGYATGTNAGAGFFTNSNTNNVKPTIDVKNYGKGEGVLSTSFGTGPTFRGQTNKATITALFTNDNNDNNIHVVEAQYNGNGTSGNVAVLGTADSAGTGNGTGVKGIGGFTGIYGKGGTYAGYFYGNVRVTGNLSKGGGSFLIDDPLDPANKYLYHSFVESPDMMNIYNGNITTDSKGIAVVTLPEYFDTLNIDYRYQLTPIGKFAQVIVLKKIKNNRFVIKSSVPNVEVSWQVTGIRNDPYAQKHRIIPVVEKEPQNKGKYLYPELYGKPKTDAIDYEETNIIKNKAPVSKGK